MKRFTQWLALAALAAGCGGSLTEQQSGVSASEGCPPDTVIDCGCGVCLTEWVPCPILPPDCSGPQPLGQPGASR